MFDINKYIDSFVMIESGNPICCTPAEQARIIIQSHRCTMKEKIRDLQELVDNYDDKDIAASLQLWKELLDDRYNNAGVIFLANLQEKGAESDRLSAYRFFSTYEKALEFLKKEKNTYIEGDDLRGICTYGEIWRMEVDTDNPGCDLYYFDNQMRLVDIICCSERTGKSALNVFCA